MASFQEYMKTWKDLASGKAVTHPPSLSPAPQPRHPPIPIPHHVGREIKIETNEKGWVRPKEIIMPAPINWGKVLLSASRLTFVAAMVWFLIKITIAIPKLF